MNAELCKEAAAQNLMPNYGTRGVILTRGKGSRVWDIDGREYLDFLSGISVNNLGHCPDRVVGAVQRQVAELMHCSNLYLVPQQVELARQLCELCFAERAFFANSGAEVNEGAIKMARLYSRTKFGENRHEIITFKNSFHGRTLATLTATGQEKVQKGFDPLPAGFHYAVFNDIESVKSLIGPGTCAIMIEPVQGEGGVTPVTLEFIRALRELCDEKQLLLIFDEIQCGMGRCGTMFAHQAYGIEPDIMTLAKALGNGLPIGALLAREEIAQVFQAGTHGSTFGGGPVVCAAALAVLEEMRELNIPAVALETGNYFAARLKSTLAELPVVKEVRGLGLMVGVELTVPGADVVKQCQEKGVLLNCTMGNVLRMLPPLNVTREDCDHVAQLLGEIVSQLPEPEQVGV